MTAKLNDRWWRLNNLYWIVDEHGNRIKFKPENREVQTYLYNNLWFFNEILKARQHGITTFFCLLFLDVCLFKSNIEAGIIAHNAKDASKFFKRKVKYAYDNLEVDAIKLIRKPKGDSASELAFANGSSITVGTSLRSSTLQYLLVSEYGKLCAQTPEKAREVRTGALNTVHVGGFVAIESTAEGIDGHYYDLVQTARNLQKTGAPLTKMDYKHFFFSWHRKPEYRLDPEGVIIPGEMKEYFQELELKYGVILDDWQKAWYVKKFETQLDEMKREFPSTEDEAFEASVIGAYYRRQMTKTREDGRICDVPYNPGALVHTGWDLGVDDNMAIWFYQLAGPWVDFIDYYENKDEDLAHYVGIMNEKRYMYGNHYAPHDIKKRGSVIDVTPVIDLAKTELNISFTKIPRANDFVEDINQVRQLFYRFRFDKARCNFMNGAREWRGIHSLDSYRKGWDKQNMRFKDKPVKNWATDAADALRTVVHGVLAESKLDVPKAPRPQQDHQIANLSSGYMAY